MHRPRHAHTIRSSQITAVLLCLNRFLIVATVALLIIAALTADVDLSIKALILGGVTAVSVVVQWTFASGAKCPLCMMPVLSRKGCSKHRHAKCVMGSHRMPVAMAILFKGHFRCPYCNEPTLLELKSTAASARRS